MSTTALALFLLCQGLTLAVQQKPAVWTQRDATLFSTQGQALAEKKRILRGVEDKARAAEAKVAQQEAMKKALERQVSGAETTREQSSETTKKIAAETAILKTRINETQHYFPNLQLLLDKVVEDNFYAETALKEIGEVNAQTQQAVEHLSTLNKHLLGKDVKGSAMSSADSAGAPVQAQAQEGVMVVGSPAAPPAARGLFDRLERDGLQPRFQGFPAKPWAPAGEPAQGRPHKRAAAAGRTN